MQQTRVDVFEEIFLVFLGLGTLVGVVVVAYTLYNAYKYRDEGDETADVDRPVLGELPTGGQGGKKLFLSFFLSAIIVVSLIVWTYGMLLYVEDGPNPDENAVEIDVEGQTFSWLFEYQDEYESEDEDEQFDTVNDMLVPADRTIAINVTSNDVWHTFGISQERVKADAKPGESIETWFIAEEPGQYDRAIECFELCGEGHSAMDGNLIVVDGDLYDAASEAYALDVLIDGIDAGELDVDSDPAEFEEYLDAQEEEEEDDEDDEDTDEDEDDEADDDDEDDGGDD